MGTTLQHEPVPDLRLLILGAGAVVTEYYLPALRKLGWLRDAVVVDPVLASVESVRNAAPEVAAHQLDFHAALDQPEIVGSVDAVVIAVPNSLHEEAAHLALERGLHVLCEKPLADTQAACLRLAAAAEKANRTLSVGMVRRLLPSFSMLHDALGQGLIGRLEAIDIEDGEPYAWLSDSGTFFQRKNGGVLADMGVHYLDLSQLIGGQLKPVCYSDDYQGGVEANLEYHLETLFRSACATGALPYAHIA